MSAKKTITVTRRRHEFFVWRRRFRCNLFCEQCQAESEFLSLDDAVLFSGLTTREIMRRVEGNDIHFLETIGGHLFVCRTSLDGKQSVNHVEIKLLENHDLLDGETKSR